MSSSVKPPFIIDCQVFQSDAKDRGMGKYSRELVSALHSVAQQEFSEVVFIFNENLEKNEEVEALLSGMFTNGRIEYLPLHLAKNLFDTSKILQKNKKVLDRFIESRGYVQPSYLILSLFLYEICPAFPSNATKLLLFYDLIPYLYFERYEDSEATYKDNYLERFNIVFEADIIYTISQTVANDLAVFIGIPHEKMRNINGASVDRTKLETTQPAVAEKIPGKYILMPSGEDLRKNNEAGVRGFKLFNEAHGNQYKLVLTSRFSDESQQNLQLISGDVLFAGNVSESEFAWLYDNCSSVYFPTEYEGLGMPILEAIDFNKPIACSNIAVFNEMSVSAFCYFDPHDDQDMATALAESIDFTTDAQEYKKINKRFTWNQSVKSLLEELHEFDHVQVEPITKKKIAIVCPDPTGYSAIGKVVAESHYTMSKYFDIEYYFDRGPKHQRVRTTYLSSVARAFEASDFTQEIADQYDAIIYHIGNSEYHIQTVIKSLTIPGMAVFHDTNLEGLYSVMHEYGHVSSERVAAEAQLDQLRPSTAKFVSSIVNNQSAIIAHSLYSQRALQESINGAFPAVSAVNLPVSVSSFNSQAVKKRHVAVGLAGIIARVKGTDLIDALLKDDRFDDCKFFVIGHTVLRGEEIQKLKDLKRVELIGNPIDLDFQSYVSKLDVLVNFREQYNGEASLSTLESLRHGVVPVVRKIGWYDELPGAIAMKATDHDSVVEHVHTLVASQKKRSTMSIKAQSVITEEFSHAQYAKALYDAVVDSVDPA